MVLQKNNELITYTLYILYILSLPLFVILHIKYNCQVSVYLFYMKRRLEVLIIEEASLVAEFRDWNAPIPILPFSGG